MTTATIPAGPIFADTEVVTASTTSTIGSTFTLLKTVSIALDGEKKNEGTRKLVSDWLKTNKKGIKYASMTEELDVSSWACVVDVTFGVMADVRAVVASTTTQGAAQAVGTTGDVAAVLVNVDAGAYTQGALKIARTITTAYAAATASVAAVAQVSDYVVTTAPLTVTVDYTKTTNTATVGTWGAAAACSTKFIGACNGLDAPWGLGALTKPVAAVGTTAAVDGKIRAYKWLGDKGSKDSKVWQIEKDDKLNVLAYEFVD